MNTKNKRSISSIKKNRPAIYKLILFFYIYAYTTATLDDITRMNPDNNDQMETSKNQNNFERNPSLDTSLKSTSEQNSTEFSNSDQQSYEWDYPFNGLFVLQEDNTELVGLNPLLKNELNLKLENIFKQLDLLNGDIQNEYFKLFEIRRKIEKLYKLVDERVIEEQILLANLKIVKEKYSKGFKEE
ncbi:hypothetical protein NEAUS04_1600 [Nematocida ausubeli]|nr:hypothetical protein NEAUS04_1600 [Nematocida ausubeli]